MSLDTYLYLKEPEHFSVSACEAYLDAWGFHGHFDPGFDPLRFEGALPFVGTADLPGDGVSYRVAFEYYLDPYVFEPEPPRKPTLWERLLGKRPPDPDSPADPYPGATHVMLLSCPYHDSLSPLLAYGLAAYALEACDGVLYDPQDDKTYRTVEEIREIYATTLAYLLREREKGRLCLCREGDEAP